MTDTLLQVLDIREISPGDVRTAGGKGAGLAALVAAGLPVPGGFVVPTGWYDRFMQEDGLAGRISALLTPLDAGDVDGLRKASAEIGEWMQAGRPPEGLMPLVLEHFDALAAPLVAVRSSASMEDGTNAAWAGQLETFLGTSRGDLSLNIRKCWASLFSPRALAYRLRQGLLLPDLSVAVLVQEMIDSEVAGVAFSVHPVTEDPDRMIIEAAFGLGESVVSGLVTPDDYIVRKSDMSLLESTVRQQERGLFLDPSGGAVWRVLPPVRSRRAKLSPRRVRELAEMVVRIEQISGRPMDVEWALAGSRWAILQGRPITTLGARR